MLIAGQTLNIDGITYNVAEHPSAPGIPFCQEGRAAWVYQLIAENQTKRALKVFKPHFRDPSQVGLAKKIEHFSDLPGLEVCRRQVLSGQQHIDLLRQYPELTYTVLMPWIEGPTWFDVISGKKEITSEQSLNVANAFIRTLVTMEETGIAHCDLSGANLILPMLAEGKSIALVDVEGLYGPQLTVPRQIMSGTSGYAHKSVQHGIWAAEADRFAGAILIAEMLGWCEKPIREAAWSDSYFKPTEMHQDTERYEALEAVLYEHWGANVSRLFTQAWHSDSLQDCPTFGEWLVALPSDSTTSTTGNRNAIAQQLVAQASAYEAAGDLDAALQSYKQAQTFATAPGLVEELKLIIQELEDQAAHKPETELDLLFNKALEEYQKQAWQGAEELLQEVVRQEPGYHQGSYEASTLLKEVQTHINKPLHPDVPSTSKVSPIAAGKWALLIVGLIIAGAIIIPPYPPDPTPELVETPDASPSVVSETPAPALMPTSPSEYKIGDTWVRPADEMPMLYVPAGTFKMGSTEAEIEATFNQCEQKIGQGQCQRKWFQHESPQHTVILIDFWVDQNEVNNAQYQLCVEENACPPPTNCGEMSYDDASQSTHPVVCVDWHAAADYCAWAGGRLLTEAEWEYAARGPNSSTYPWGNMFDASLSNFCDSSCNYNWQDTNYNDEYEETAPVNSFFKGESWCGTLNMAGNVGEWTSDWYGPYSSKTQLNPVGPADGSEKVLKGGSWYSMAAGIRAASRDGDIPTNLYNSVGFRCALTTIPKLPPTPAATSTLTPPPTSTPGCSFEPQGVFSNVWRKYRDQLGCPLNQAKVINDAEEFFQNRSAEHTSEIKSREVI